MNLTAFAIYMTGVLLIAAPFVIDTIKQEKRLAKGRR
jgi:hypothetical protein